MKVAMVTCIEAAPLTVYSYTARQDVETQPAVMTMSITTIRKNDARYNGLYR